MPEPTEPLRNEVRIAAPPELVFPYFTDPARMVHWMGVAALLDPRPGGTFRVEANGRDCRGRDGHVRLHLGDDHQPRRRPAGARRARPYFNAGEPLPG
jgi:hypothetical protein